MNRGGSAGESQGCRIGEEVWLLVGRRPGRRGGEEQGHLGVADPCFGEPAGPLSQLPGQHPRQAAPDGDQARLGIAQFPDDGGDGGEAELPGNLETAGAENDLEPSMVERAEQEWLHDAPQMNAAPERHERIVGAVRFVPWTLVDVAAADPLQP
jgi:hypothetical protein